MPPIDAIREGEDLRNRIRDHIAAQDDEVRHAERLFRTVKDQKGAKAATEALIGLRDLLDEVAERPLLRTRTQPGQKSSAVLKWEDLTDDIKASEDRWGRLATLQMSLAILIVPIGFAGIGALMAGANDLDGPSAAIVVTGLGSATLAAMFFLLRIQQQARLAQERLTEKRIALAFLRLAYSEYDSPERFITLVESGTSMFLGHHTPETLPLSPTDVQALGNR